MSKENEMGREKKTFIKVEGQKFAYMVINVVKKDGWIEFDRINTHTLEVSGHFNIPMSQIVSIEER